jgi:hypothetical protein
VAKRAHKILYCANRISRLVFLRLRFTAALDFSKPRTAVLMFLIRRGISTVDIIMPLTSTLFVTFS